MLLCWGGWRAAVGSTDVVVVESQGDEQHDSKHTWFLRKQRLMASHTQSHSHTHAHTPLNISVRVIMKLNPILLGNGESLPPPPCRQAAAAANGWHDEPAVAHWAQPQPPWHPESWSEADTAHRDPSASCWEQQRVCNSYRLRQSGTNDYVPVRYLMTLLFNTYASDSFIFIMYISAIPCHIP